MTDQAAGIPIIVDEDNATAKGIFSKRVAKAVINPAALKENMSKLTSNLMDVFKDIQAVGAFQLNEITVSVSVDAEGGVALIGTASVKVGAEIELKFSK